MMLILTTFRRAIPGRGSLRFAAVAAALAVLLPVPLVFAQSNPQTNFHLFRPSLHAGDTLGVHTATVGPTGTFGAGAWMTFANNPVVVENPDGSRYSLVKNQSVADVFGSVALFDRLSLGLGVPVYADSSGDAPPASANMQRASGYAVGDLRASAKARLYGGKGDGVGLAFVEALTFPTAQQGSNERPNNFTGDSGVTSTTYLTLDWGRGGLNTAMNVGYRERPQTVVAGRTIPDELIASGGVVVPFICGKFEGFGTLEGRTAAAHPLRTKQDNALDAHIGARVGAGDFQISGLFGAGATEAYGQPDYRAGIGLAYSPVSLRACTLDTDGDGIADADDRCKDVAGDKAAYGCPDSDKDGIADADDKCKDQSGPSATLGCPDSDFDAIADWEDKCPHEAGIAAELGCPGDSDKDGLADAQDQCPNQWGKKELSGCPDSDNDGIADAQDQCPNQAGEKKFFGCADTDHDGIADAQDKCPSELGASHLQGCPDKDGDGLADADDRCPKDSGPVATLGCPDRDGDGLADADDKCPDVPGLKDKSGCPVMRVTVAKDRIYITEKIFFVKNKATILPQSYSLVQEIAKAIKDNPDIRQVRIDGHTCDLGSSAHNAGLSQRRAESVKAALVRSGVAVEKLVAMGFGEDQPLVANSDESTRSINRRVEFTITDRASMPAGPVEVSPPPVLEVPLVK